MNIRFFGIWEEHKAAVVHRSSSTAVPKIEQNRFFFRILNQKEDSIYLLNYYYPEIILLLLEHSTFLHLDMHSFWI
jgi:hypothetical protein